MRIDELEGSDSKKKTPWIWLMQPTSFTVANIGGGKLGDHVPMVAEPRGVGTRAIKLVLRGSVAMGIEREMKQSGP